MLQNFWIRDRIRVRLFFKFENPTPDQTPATIIDPAVIYPRFYLRNDQTDSCYCVNEKVIPDPGPVFHKFLTPDPSRKEKRGILPESTPYPVPSLLSSSILSEVMVVHTFLRQNFGGSWTWRILNRVSEMQHNKKYSSTWHHWKQEEVPWLWS